MGLIKKLFKKYSVRFRKKDISIIDNQLKDYGDFDIDIVYARDYLLKLDNMTIKPYIVFCIVIDISKEDIIRDYYDNFIPFITSIDTDYIVNTKDNKLYTYVGLNKFTNPPTTPLSLSVSCESLSSNLASNGFQVALYVYLNISSNLFSSVPNQVINLPISPDISIFE